MDLDERHEMLDHIRIVEKLLNAIHQGCTSENTFNVRLIRNYASQAKGHLDVVKTWIDPVKNSDPNG